MTNPSPNDIDAILGIEDCLRELREMFPGTLCEIRSRFATNGETNCSVAVGNYWIDATGKIFLAPTLSECMAQVRSWKQE